MSVEAPGRAGWILEVPQRLSRLRRALDTGLTGLAAGAYVAVIRPALMLALWCLGLRLAHAESRALSHPAPQASLATLGMAAVAIALAVLVWNRVHAWSFRASRRQERQRRATPAELSSYFSLTAASLEQLRASPRVEVARPARAEVRLTVAGGQTLRARHDPLGPAPRRRPGCCPVIQPAIQAVPAPLAAAIAAPVAASAARAAAPEAGGEREAVAADMPACSAAGRTG